VPDSARLAQN